VEGNALTDTESRPVVRGVLSKIPSLRAYDISGNAFKIPTKAVHATPPPAVHVVLHIDADTRQLCPGVPIEGFAHNCGEMMYEVEDTNLGMLDCAVRAAAAEVVADDGVDVSLRRERVMPFRSSGSLVSYTVHVQPPPRKTTGTAAAVERVRAALAALADDPKALRRAAEAGGCDAQRTAWLSMLPVVAVDARAGCAPGLHGPGCTYACMGRW